MDIMRALRTVVNSNMEIPENKAEISRFGKNFLPILFNLYTTKPTDSEAYSQRMSALDTIKIYLKIADSAVITNMYDKALEKGNDEKSDDVTKEAIFDLLCCLLEYVDGERMTNLYKCVVNNINKAEGGTDGKKNYKILEEICKLQTVASNEFFENNLSELKDSLVKSIRRNKAGTQVHRLKTIACILQNLKEPKMEFAEFCIPEAIMCINVSSSRTRLAAYLVLQSVIEAMLRWRPDEKDDVFRKYANHVMHSLMEENTERLALFALTKLYYEYKDLIPLDVVDQMMTNVLLLIKANTPQIAIACMSFLKVFVCRAPLTVTAKYLPNIMLGICDMTDSNKKHTRVKTKDLLDRLVRKFGSEMVNSLVTKNDTTMQKRLKAVRKEQSKKDRAADTKEEVDDLDFNDTNFLPVGKSRQKTMDDILADSDDDFSDIEDEGEGGNTRGRSRKGDKKNNENNAYIKEGEDDILDFLSSKDVSQKITTTKPIDASEIQEKKEIKRKARKEAFKTASDGRLIISDNPKDYAGSDSDDNDEDEMDTLQVAKAPVDKDDYEDDDEETFESMVAKKKRKFGSEAGSVKSRMSTGTGKSGKSGYKPGGSGIHRATSTAPGSEYKSKKSHGDTKVKGRPDPYAYIPMTHKSLNKRKTAGAQKKSVFKNLVKAARKGAVKGAKLNAKQHAKMKR